MAQGNRLDVEFSQEHKDEIREAARRLSELLMPPLVSLSARERKELPKTGEKSYSFVGKSLDYARRNPGLVPAYLRMENFERDFAAMEFLKEMHQVLMPLASALEDTYLLAGSETYQGALAFYRSVKGAAESGDAAARSILRDLAVRFAENGPRKKPVE